MAYETYTVKKGDTLWSIAAAKLGDGNRWKELARLNNISEKNPIVCVDQVIKIDVKNDKPTTVKNNTNKAKINHFGLQSDSDNTIFATWIWTKSHTDNYRIIWYYATGDGVWFVGNDSTVDVKQSTYSIPSNAHRVRFKVKPIAKKHKVNKKDVARWNADWSSIKEYNIKNNPPLTPSGLTASIEKYQLTAEIDNLDVNGTHIEFQIVKNNNTTFKTGMAEIKKSHASFSCKISLGNSYKVRCRAYRKTDKKYSDWSDYTDNMKTIPSAPKDLVVVKALSETSVRIVWEESSTSNVTGYEIQYTTKKYYFDSSNEVQSMSIDAALGHAEITGLDSGQTYYCRVRAKNEKGESGWTNIETFVTGKKPAAPTTWSSTTTAISGELVTLYWVHNSEDGSSQTYAELELIINGTKKTLTIQNSKKEDEKDLTSYYTLPTSDYDEGGNIKWRVRTSGITNDYGDWSIQRTIDIYSPPTLQIGITDKNDNVIDNNGTIYSFPFYISAVPGPNTQKPIGYHVAIFSELTYDTVDNVGNEKIVSKGQYVYSKFFDTTNVFPIKMLPSDLSIESNQYYRLKVTVSMDSGLTAESELYFFTSFDDNEYQPEARIAVDKDAMIAYISPICEIQETKNYKVINESGSYTTTTEEITDITDVITNEYDVVYIASDQNGNLIYYCVQYCDDYGNPIPEKYVLVTKNSNTYTVTNEILDRSLINDVITSDSYEKVLLGTLTDGTEIFYCSVEESSILPNVSLAVYRREFDGNFTEIASNLNNENEVYIVDPHPSLDYARYRIVATDNSTGTISYYDPPGEPIGEKSAVIQWDEEYSNFVASAEDALEQPPWSGSIVKLPYNLDVSDKYSPDVSLVSYIGREHPVSYYGTQIGQTQSWNVVIEKDDESTLYILRKLAIYMGDVYVREPSGSGYWANIKVSFSQTHLDMTIPVSIDITRVEGGI